MIPKQALSDTLEWLRFEVEAEVSPPRPSPALLQPLPDKPKYMHRETYERITYQIQAYELAAAKELKEHREERWLAVLLKLDELTAEL